MEYSETTRINDLKSKLEQISGQLDGEDKVAAEKITTGVLNILNLSEDDNELRNGSGVGFEVYQWEPDKKVPMFVLDIKKTLMDGLSCEKPKVQEWNTGAVASLIYDTSIQNVSLVHSIPSPGANNSLQENQKLEIWKLNPNSQPIDANPPPKSAL